MASADLLIPRAEVAAREVGDGAVLVDMSSGACFELNPVGFDIWKLLQQRMTVEEVCDALGKLYPVDREVLVGDVGRLIDSLIRAGLVEPGVRR